MASEAEKIAWKAWQDEVSRQLPKSECCEEPCVPCFLTKPTFGALEITIRCSKCNEKVADVFTSTLGLCGNFWDVAHEIERILQIR